MTSFSLLLLAWGLTAAPERVAAPEVGVSPTTEGCLGCHADVTPGLVADWRASTHARVAVAGASVGCAECHALAPERHPDTFEHGDARVHVVVSPADCATCHEAEATQFGRGLMAHAHGNLVDNPLYRDLTAQVNAPVRVEGGALRAGGASAATEATSCLACHGTVVRLAGLAPRETPVGEMTFPVLEGWPSQGVGRVNPDGSLGACSACHARHGFSRAHARHAAACRGCHKGPDVPAYAVWLVSRHGALAEASEATTDFAASPWVPGRDLRAPTCATCHLSALASASGEVLAVRTHDPATRLSHRIFGLPYAAPHPASGDTHAVRNAAGLALPTELDGRPVAAAAIDEAEQGRRREALQRVCGGCHAGGWVRGHFERQDAVIVETNAATKAATDLLGQAWALELATGPAQGGSAFDEPIERAWVETWLFFANSTRFAAAMGGADYGVFAGGRWQLAKALRELEAWVKERSGPGALRR